MRHIQFKERKAIRIKIGFCPKKEQVRHEAFEVAFNRFNRNTRSCDLNLYRGYRLLAIDGSSLNIALNRESETYYPPLCKWFRERVQPVPSQRPLRYFEQFIYRLRNPAEPQTIRGGGRKSHGQEDGHERLPGDSHL